MQVTYLHHTPISVLAQATAMPYQSEPTPDLVRRVWDKGHRSIARHGMISFLVQDVSVSLLTQISRHPHINLTVQSSRYCDMSERECVVPPHVKSEDLAYYEHCMDIAIELYRHWNTRKGYSNKEQQEISKMFLPKASTVDMVVSGNYQAVYEFLELRMCSRVEYEINKLAKWMAGICQTFMMPIFKNVGPRCDTCKEPCGGDTNGTS